jgi:predicted esterase
MRVTYVVGEQEEWAPVPAVEAQAASLRDAGVTVEVIRFAGGHEIRPEVVARLV